MGVTAVVVWGTLYGQTSAFAKDTCLSDLREQDVDSCEYNMSVRMFLFNGLLTYLCTELSPS
jgi:hypothetical protein